MRFWTTEYVSKGHPDKIADQISDALLDEFLRIDINARVAIETLVKSHCVVLAGEVTCKDYHKIDIERAVRHTIHSIGYNKSNGLDPDNITIINLLTRQSSEISRAVDDSKKEKVAAGDQGFVIGYATDETPEYMPLGVMITRKLVQTMSQITYGVGPDAKSQVTLVKDLDDKFVGLDSLVLSVMHRPDISIRNVVHDHLDSFQYGDLISKGTKVLINPAGMWTIGGPVADCGLTGRKIVVDAYGSDCQVGGGAFSGKDPSKVDRSGAYMARYLAKNIVASGIAKKCRVQFGYVIGELYPVSFDINTFGTSSVEDSVLVDIIPTKFDLSVHGIIEFLKLKRPIYLQTARNGHFGISDYTWEKVDKDKFSDIYVKASI